MYVGNVYHSHRQKWFTSIILFTAIILQQLNSTADVKGVKTIKIFMVSSVVRMNQSIYAFIVIIIKKKTYAKSLVPCECEMWWL